MMPLYLNRSLALNDNNYYKKHFAKNLIVIHHTVGGSALSAFNWWQCNSRKMATAYIIDRDGMIYEIFDPQCWAYHLGLKGTKGIHDKRSIGIELVSWGGLVEKDGEYYCNDLICPEYKFSGEIYDHTELWRGYRYFETYSEFQMSSLVELACSLIEKFSIVCQTPEDCYSFNPQLISFKGILGHNQLRKDKTDPHPGFDWEGLIAACRLTKY